MIDQMEWMKAVVDCRQPMNQQTTSVEPQLSRLTGIRAVIFDVYGTLVISGSGDVGSVDATPHDQALGSALEAVGLPTSEGLTVENLHRQIAALNAARKNEQCPKPEVDIVEAWRMTLSDAQVECPIETVVRLACQYEARANPTWPMPGAAELLDSLRAAKTPSGIVSNAQIFTIPLVLDLLDAEDLPAAGFDLDLCVFSNRYRQAKPGPRLFDVLREALTRQGIRSNEAIYVGNDMLNDVWAASQAGLRTAWFAGEQRSCRARADDPRCQSLQPDVVLTSLTQLLQCIELQ
ncbi:MAG: HAD family hydrolase [Planctomycetota bacterium]